MIGTSLPGAATADLTMVVVLDSRLGGSSSAPGSGLLAAVQAGPGKIGRISRVPHHP
jgi:hypothetical protein